MGAAPTSINTFVFALVGSQVKMDSLLKNFIDTLYGDGFSRLFYGTEILQTHKKKQTLLCFSSVLVRMQGRKDL